MATEVPPASTESTEPEAYNSYDIDISFVDGPRLPPDPQTGSRFAARLDRMNSNSSEDLDQAVMMSLTSFTAYKYMVRPR